jgi:opacity protein-like surface antigen
MKRLLMVLTALAVLVPSSLWAQDVPKAEVFGGFSILTVKDEDESRVTFPGWQASVAANINQRFGIVGDISGNYKNDATTCPSCKIHTFLFGPRISNRVEKATVFGHALFGAAKFSATGFSDSNFSMGFGGGVDINTSEKLAIRIVQFDWLLVKEDGGTGGSSWQKNNLRFGFGVVYKSGSK